ncbi:MAG: iron chelate uptake ABC transporter family permease subunit [Acidimicrobiia bacterium]
MLANVTLGRSAVDDGTNRKRAWLIITVLGLAVAGATIAYMTMNVRGSWSFVFELRSRRVMAMTLVGGGIAYSTVLFQTVTGNRILTPSIMGFDSLYVLIQTVIAYFFGTSVFSNFGPRGMFLLDVSLMIVFAGILYKWLFGRKDSDIYVLVLVGIVFGAMFGSLTSLVSRLIDPNDFVTLQDRFFASFGSVDKDLLGIAAVLLVATSLYGWRLTRTLDVVALGQSHSKNLGVEYHRVVNKVLILVAIQVSVSTALVGPITFFGLLVANLSYQLLGTFKHRFTIPTAVLLGVLALVGGQLILEQIFRFNTTLSIIINFVGGIYFIGALIREAKH